MTGGKGDVKSAEVGMKLGRSDWQKGGRGGCKISRGGHG